MLLLKVTGVMEHGRREQRSTLTPLSQTDNKEADLTWKCLPLNSHGNLKLPDWELPAENQRSTWILPRPDHCGSGFTQPPPSGRSWRHSTEPKSLTPGLESGLANTKEVYRSLAEKRMSERVWHLIFFLKQSPWEKSQLSCYFLTLISWLHVAFALNHMWRVLP
jgi:hypothetical protein